MRFRTLTVGLVVGVLALAATACGKEGGPGSTSGGPTASVAQNVKIDGSPTFDRMTKAGKITIGVKDDQPGIGRRDPVTGKYTGFDVEIGKLVAAGLGFSEDKIEFKPTPSSVREQAIQNGQVDIVIASYTINDKRKKLISFAGPYFVAGQSLLVRKDDNSITGKDSLKGKKACAATGSASTQRLREQKLTEPGGEVVELAKYSDCVTKLEQGDVDAVSTDDAILKGFAAEESDKLKVVGEPFSTEPYGIGMNHDDSALRNAVNDILQKILDNGDWQKAYDATLGKAGGPAPAKPTIERY